MVEHMHHLRRLCFYQERELLVIGAIYHSVPEIRVHLFLTPSLKIWFLPGTPVASHKAPHVIQCYRDPCSLIIYNTWIIVLDWFLVVERISFKTFMLTRASIANAAPTYTRELSRVRCVGHLQVGRFGKSTQRPSCLLMCWIVLLEESDITFM